jgi:hypothetical protein
MGPVNKFECRKARVQQREPELALEIVLLSETDLRGGWLASALT